MINKRRFVVGQCFVEQCLIAKRFLKRAFVEVVHEGFEKVI